MRLYLSNAIIIAVIAATNPMVATEITETSIAEVRNWLCCLKV